VIECKYTTC